MARTARALAILAACAALCAGCGLLPAAPGTLGDAAGQQCGPAARTSGTAALTSAPGTIRFAIGPDDIDWLTPVIQRWNKAHPGSPVQPLYLPAAANGQLAQLVADLQARSCLYDVIDMDVVWTAQFASSGWIIPLVGLFSTGGFLTRAVATATYDGRLYAVPDYTNADLLYYRKDIIKSPPATWAALAADVAKYARAGSGLSGYAATLAQYEGLTVCFAEAVQSEGGSLQSPDGTVTASTPQALHALQAMVSWVKDGVIPQQDLGFEETQAQQAFESGRFLFMSNWPDSYAAMQAHGSPVAGKFDVAALPEIVPGTPGSSLLGGANLAISAYSRHQQAALAFIRYLTSAKSQLAMFTGGFPPVLASLYNDPALRHQYPYLTVLKQSVDNAEPRPADSTYEQASLAISAAVTAALRQRETPKQALADMQGQLSLLTGGG